MDINTAVELAIAENMITAPTTYDCVRVCMRLTELGFTQTQLETMVSAYPDSPYSFLLLKCAHHEYKFTDFRFIADIDFNKINAEFPIYTVEMHIEHLGYLSSFNFANLYPGMNMDTERKIRALNAARSKYADSLLIRPWLFKLPVRTHHTLDVWSCDDTSVINRPEIGEEAIVNRETFFERWKTFTCGKLDSAFPWGNVVISGGSVMTLLSPEYKASRVRASDCDLFIYGKTFEERSATFDKIVKYFESPETYYVIRGSVVTIYIRDLKRKFQIISSDASDITSVIRSFDLTHVQCAVTFDDSANVTSDNMQLYCTYGAYVTMSTGVSKFDNLRAVKVERMLKTLYFGYSIEKITDPKVFDITTMVTEKNEQYLEIIRGFSAHYYPVSDSEYTEKELKEYILAMILKDANGTKSTDDPTFVIDNTVISGDFTGNYAVTSYDALNIKDIVSQRLHNVVTVKSKHAPIRLLSDTLTVVNTVMGGDGLTLTLNTSLEFRQFCATCDRDIYTIFDRAGVTKQIVDTTGNIKITIPLGVLQMQVTKGYTLLRNQRGMPLDIEEELMPGDKIQFLFTILVHRVFQQARHVSFRPVTVTKFVETKKYEDQRTDFEPVDIPDTVECEYDEITYE
jgi:hypothetical protein